MSEVGDPVAAQLAVVNAARALRSVNGENVEYDRALVELTRDVLGVDRARATELVLGRSVTGESVHRPGPGPVEEGLAVIAETGAPSVQLLACSECGVLLWDVEAHWTDAHSHRLQALRAIAARG